MALPIRLNKPDFLRLCDDHTLGNTTAYPWALRSMAGLSGALLDTRRFLVKPLASPVDTVHNVPAVRELPASSQDWPTSQTRWGYSASLESEAGPQIRILFLGPTQANPQISLRAWLRHSRLLREHTVDSVAGVHLFLIAQEGTVDAMLRRWINQRVTARGPALRSLHARTARCTQDQESENQDMHEGLERAEAQTLRMHF